MTPSAEPFVRVFSGDHLLQIAMPMGGLGAGCICLNGHGGLQDFSIRNAPATSALPDGHTTKDAMFALLHVKGERPITRLLEGPLPTGKVYDQGLQSQGYRHGGYEGLPRFATCTFGAAYPFGTAILSHHDVPLDVSITGFSPFIPLDDKNSGIPAAILEYKFTNPTQHPVEFDFSCHVSHPAVGKNGHKGTRNKVMDDSGVFFWNTEPKAHETFGSAAVCVVGHRPRLKAMWFRGGWFDGISALWREVSTGQFKSNSGNSDREIDGVNGGSLLVDLRLEPGETVTVPVVICWHFPNVYQSHGAVDAACDPASGCCPPDAGPTPKWRPYYVSQWVDAGDVARYVQSQYVSLRQRTLAFRDALLSSTLPAEVLDAVSSNLAILKSPTVLRQENGNVWAWEGCFTTAGCCHGSCTHVWNYAQALPHLFPKLERTLREQELLRSIDEAGHVNFRAALPDGATSHQHHAAADGQLGGIMKLFRDWQISGDRHWLQRLYPMARRSLDYCIDRWDPHRRGALFEPHHNTYDIEFWGPDGMCGSVYVGALAAMAEMADELGLAADADQYRRLAQRGARFLNEELFNGEYYYHKVLWKELRDQSFVQAISQEDAGSEEFQLLKQEGPKYQYGTGCISDGVIGAWMAAIYGVPSPQDRENTRRTLAAIFRYNFKPDLSDHPCTQRPGYAIGNEAGLLLCSWPRGGKPTLPFPYSDEVWTGIEYQVASHLIEEGKIEEGLTLVRAARSRYEGKVRNPFNEYECGSYYARAMASYALLNSLSGFRYSAVTQTLWFGPKLSQRPFQTFFSTAEGWGTASLDGQSLTIAVREGRLPLRHVCVTLASGPVMLDTDMIADASQPAVLAL